MVAYSNAADLNSMLLRKRNALMQKQNEVG